MLHGKNKYIGRAPGGVTISIQEDLEHPGITLQCTAFSVQYEEAEEECGGCDTSIFPSDIEKIIRAGLARGWDPTEGQGTFHPGKLKLEQYEVEEPRPKRQLENLWQ